MFNLSKYTDVFEKGTVTTQGGQVVASRHALHAIAAMRLLVDAENNESIHELLDAGIGRKISETTIEMLGSAAPSLLENGRFMTQATAAVINDIVMPNITDHSKNSYFLDVGHYNRQFDEQAKKQGVLIKWDNGCRPVLHPNSAVA